MPKPKVAVYGLTTEGYGLAAKIIEKASVTIIDETLQMAMDLEAQMIRSHRTVQELIGDEMLMGLKPVSQVLSEASVIFFTPKLRKSGDESVIESSTKLRDLAKYASSHSSIVNMLPTGVGGNQDNMAVLEKQTGLKMGEGLNYGYSPLAPRGEPGPIAMVARSKDFLPIEDLGLKRTPEAIPSLELQYVADVLGVCTSIATEIELMKRCRERGASLGSQQEQRYVDKLAALVYDLTAIQSSEDVGEPITYLAGAALKSLENYTRYVVDETRNLLKELQLKASRTRVLVAWSADKSEMRAGRLTAAKTLAEKLRDYVTDVQQVELAGRNEEIIDTYKHNVAIVCTPEDYEWFKGLKKSFRGSEISILQATSGIRRE